VHASPVSDFKPMLLNADKGQKLSKEPVSVSQLSCTCCSVSGCECAVAISCVPGPLSGPVNLSLETWGHTSGSGYSTCTCFMWALQVTQRIATCQPLSGALDNGRVILCDMMADPWVSVPTPSGLKDIEPMEEQWEQRGEARHSPTWGLLHIESVKLLWVQSGQEGTTA
jgi:hypothetical protein